MANLLLHIEKLLILIFLISSMLATGLILTLPAIIAPLRNARLVTLVALNFRALLGVLGSGAILAALLYFAGLFLLGWLAGGSKPELRGALGLSTTARNFGAALVPATGSFSDPKVTIMIIVGAIVCFVVSFLAAGQLRKKSFIPTGITP